VVQVHTRRDNAFLAAPPGADRSRFAIGSLRLGGAMENDSIQGDEWDAYVTLDTFSTNGTRDRLWDASPRATESP
jgi:hypothetical protein